MRQNLTPDAGDNQPLDAAQRRVVRAVDLLRIPQIIGKRVLRLPVKVAVRYRVAQ